ncbi:MAG: hypothetical protein ACU0DW_10170, partial [Shimia sp.]
PFPYERQRRRATRVIIAPGQPNRGKAPVRVLSSIGRCGSTFAGAVLHAAGAPVLGEIDIFTDLGDHARAAPGDLHLRTRLKNHALDAFAAMPEGVIVKLRSQATAAIEALDDATTQAPIFLIRDIGDWHRSMKRAFPDERDRSLFRALAASLNAVAARADGIVLSHYESLKADPDKFARRILGGEAQRIGASVAQKDSQRGTSLDRRRVASRPVNTAAALALWRSMAPHAALERLGLRLDLTPR